MECATGRLSMSTKSLTQADFRVGMQVTYRASHLPLCAPGEKGIVKEIPEHTTDAVRVVYHCGGEWDRYQDFTSALTNIEDLWLGW